MAGQGTEPVLQAIDRQVRHPPRRFPAEAVRGIPDHRRRALPDRLHDESTAVQRATRAGNEHVAGLHAAAVERERSHRHAQRCERGRIEGQHGGRMDRHTSSFTSIPGGGSTMLLNGASCATPSMRSVPAVIWLNIGAATAPP